MNVRLGVFVSSDVVDIAAIFLNNTAHSLSILVLWLLNTDFSLSHMS